MRDIFIRGAACPDCGSKEFHPGPMGGSARNLMCAQCGSFFWFSPPFPSHRIESKPEYFDQTQRLTLAQFEAADQKARIERLQDLLNGGG